MCEGVSMKRQVSEKNVDRVNTQVALHVAGRCFIAKLS